MNFFITLLVIKGYTYEILRTVRVCSVAQLCPTLCDSVDCSPRGSSVHGISRQEYWSRLSCPPPGDLSDLGIEFTSPALTGGFFTTEPPAAAAAAKLLQSCPTLCDPIDGSPLRSSVPGILQVRILEWVAISFSIASCKYYLIDLTKKQK